MKEVTTIGLDLAKNVFQVHGVDGLEQILLNPGHILQRRSSLCIGLV